VVSYPLNLISAKKPVLADNKKCGLLSKNGEMHHAYQRHDLQKLKALFRHIALFY